MMKSNLDDVPVYPKEAPLHKQIPSRSVERMHTHHDI